MIIGNRQQAALLEQYSTALARDPNCSPPTALAPDLARLAQHLARQNVPEPSAATLAAIRSRVIAGTQRIQVERLDSARATERKRLSLRDRATPGTNAVFARLRSGGRIGNALAFLVIAAVMVGATALIVVGLRERQNLGGVSGFAGQPISAPAGPCLQANASIQPNVTVTRGVPPSPIPTPLAPPSLITKDEAIAAVRAFTDEPDAHLTVEYEERTLTTLSRYRYVYLLRSLNTEGAPTQDYFFVDAATGAPIVAHFESNTAQCGAPLAPITETEARSRAEMLAHQYYPRVDQLTLRSTRPFDKADTVIQLLWQQRAPESGAWLPTQISVAISRQTGLLIHYSQEQLDYAGPTRPLVSETQALQIAQTETETDSRVKGNSVAEATLLVAAPQVDTQAEPTFRLVWQIRLDGQSLGNWAFAVDARTGVIYYNGNATRYVNR